MGWKAIEKENLELQSSLKKEYASYANKIAQAALADLQYIVGLALQLNLIP